MSKISKRVSNRYDANRKRNSNNVTGFDVRTKTTKETNYDRDNSIENNKTISVDSSGP